MEVLEDKLVFSRGDGFKWRCKLYLVNFKKLLSIPNEKQADICEFGISDLLHSVAGVCSVSLPDMEISAIYSTLTSPGCQTMVLVTSQQCVAERRSLQGHKPVNSSLATTPPEKVEEEKKEEEVVNPFSCIISDEEDSSGELEEDTGEEVVDNYEKSRHKFLEEARERQLLTDQLDRASVGAEHCLVGCAAFSRLSGQRETNAIQISLLAVRKRCRKMGIGRHLMQCCKDPEVVGHYEVLLVFADPNAEDFFQRHGFSEDPILTAHYQSVVDHWENSSLMVYLPPFSGAGLAVGSLKTLTHFQEFYKQWRDDAISGYSRQLGVMERLRHELLLLHSKVQAQDEMIVALSKELKLVKEGKNIMETEFQQYRKRSQHLLCEATAGDAQKWLNTNS